ncbi:hypothetical protein TPHA_0A03700 [Tetrapisispora phaffii CBS 4417]|uniref:non-specific serine/threonine protein kinase n=1 Tax=Tetrapisispora phaffii (strain ATCC 24235 / CBS 4417 / NBRC 1672 / NRRL Y-8282 / UCD 70-5) TaxID=1071381 RepID=G8BNG8_TETPH|nr:hypothetical protein TPHA_0A03700 [Tetrapisispora phaffii CBS 4417]CCE61446.1 hypothetical protein TPHA_0A03700 [Tetrapisispora phaffii CBS 4417]
MGGQISLLVQTSASIGIFSYIDVLDNVHYISQVNSSRFLKTVKALDPNGEIIIKVFVKPTGSYKLPKIKNALLIESQLLAPVPNVLNYSKLIETNRAAYLLRQYMKSNLYDRLSTRPYLNNSELKFITFQLLQAVKNIHDLGICHGDLKTENILVTSSNWIFLTDFASIIKPVYLPEDNPSEFFFYFDTSKRRICYVAPERFDSHKTNTPGDDTEDSYVVTIQMDIFSLGCCIAEIYSEGLALFDLSQLFKYKNNEYHVDDILQAQLISSEMKPLILDMINIDPQKRLSTDQLLSKYRGNIFPETYYTFTYDYFRELSIMNTSVPTNGEISSNSILENKCDVLDECCNKIYKDFEKICASLGYCVDENISLENSDLNDEYASFLTFDISLQIKNILPDMEMDTDKDITDNHSFIFFLSFLCHALRNLVSRESKLKTLQLILSFSRFVDDEHKFNRIVPYFVSLFEDSDPNVQSFSLRCLSELLSNVNEVTQLNENIFVDYLFPRIRKLLLASKNNTYVRIVLASSISNLVENASRFQDLFIKSYSNGNDEDWIVDLETLDITNRYMKKLSEQIEQITILLLTDTDVAVKKALLNNILSLCNFFGREKTNDIILSHLITYFNDKDSSLRIEFIELIPAISVLLGPMSIQQYILPLLIQTITDPEELVIVYVLQSLKDICTTGLVEKKSYFDICRTVAPLLLHPNTWIRQFSLILIVEISSRLSEAEVYCMLYPCIRPYFEFDVNFDLPSMISSCKQPISRSIFDLLCTWSLKASKTLFWKRIPNSSVDSFGFNNITFITKDFSAKFYGFNKSLKSTKSVIKSYKDEEIPLTAEDKSWIDKFKSMDLSSDEFWKLAILRGYILSISKNIRKKTEHLSATEKVYYSRRIKLQNVYPKTVFFEASFNSENCKYDTNLIFNDYSEQNKLDVSSSQRAPNNLISIRNLNGSIMLPTKTNPTTTSNFENVTVHLQSKYKSFSPYAKYDQASISKVQPFVVSNSYEGSEGTVRTFLDKYEILYPLHKYPEFGSNIETTVNEFDVNSYKGQLIINLTQNDFNELSVLTILPTQFPLLIIGLFNGSLKLWNISDITKSEFYSPQLTYDCSSGIVDIAIVPGYDAFSVLTQDNTILVFRVIPSKAGKLNNTPMISCIRKFNVDKDCQNISIRKISVVSIIGNTFIVALSKSSNMYFYDIKTTELIHVIRLPPEYGAIISYEIDSKSEILLAGTTHGVICMWDLRFYVLIKAWTFGDHTPITNIKLFTEYSKNHIIVAGGSKQASLTIWDYSRQQCTYAFVGSDTNIPINNFIAHEKTEGAIDANMEMINFEETYFQSYGTAIFFTTNTTRDVTILDIANINSPKSVFSGSLKDYGYYSLAMNPNLTYIARKQSTEKLNTNIQNIHMNYVTSINIANFEDKKYVISADSSGIVNIYV